MKVKKICLVTLALAALIVLVVLINQFLTLRKAHSTFENYYAFRGCVQLLQRTDNLGSCRLASGQIINLVKFHSKWYLENDLPICLFGLCL